MPDMREQIKAISRTAGDRSLSEIDLRVKIIGLCHEVLVPCSTCNGERFICVPGRKPWSVCQSGFCLCGPWKGKVRCGDCQTNNG